MHALLLAAATVLTAATAVQDDDYLYKVLLVRAAPGRLLELIDVYRAAGDRHAAVGDETPFVMRHSQGDHWDLMLVFPMASTSRYYAADRVARRDEALGGLEDRLQDLVAWREETFFVGPPLAETGPRFRDRGYYHVEMFVALPGKRRELVRQRAMENDYLERIGREANLVLEKTGGGAWDVMTIGFYRDIRHFAESGSISPEREDAAARAAGFEGADRIGTYLRSLISRHNDTLAGAVR